MKNKNHIMGVIIKSIKNNVDNRGFFREIFKLSDTYTKKKFKQISHSKIKRGVIKGWHVHNTQYQWNYLSKGRINVYLKDLRKKSPSFNKVINLELYGNKPLIYFFPPHIGHAYIALGKENHMIYGTSDIYDPTEEYKLKIDINIK
jgi:dTDP-4-dehydrorhamnose 3,5-epimerase-like enzyme